MLSHGAATNPPCRTRPKIGSDENSSFDINNPRIGDEYSEAWYELGSPIQLPFLKYLISVTSYLVDNFFLLKNTYNALVQDDGTENEASISHP